MSTTNGGKRRARRIEVRAGLLRRYRFRHGTQTAEDVRVRVRELPVWRNVRNLGGGESLATMRAYFDAMYEGINGDAAGLEQSFAAVSRERTGNAILQRGR